MKTATIVGALACAVLATAVASAQKVTTDSDPAAPFASYKTYMWTAGTPSPNPLGEQRIHAAVDGQLAARGLTQVQSDPDVYVATHVLTHEEKELIANGFGYGPWGGWGGGVGTINVQTYVQGTLIVDLYDAMTKKMVWRGVATDTASDKPQKNTKKITKALTKMFQRFPSVGGAVNN